MTGHCIRSSRGITIIELLVAALIFSTVAAALAQTLVIAQRARYGSALWMEATQLAVERLERLRAGDRSRDTVPIGVFTRTWQSAGVAGYPNLERIDVTVAWENRGAQQFTLSALLRSPL